jgi:hypothetical protein
MLNLIAKVNKKKSFLTVKGDLKDSQAPLEVFQIVD